MSDELGDDRNPVKRRFHIKVTKMQGFEVRVRVAFERLRDEWSSSGQKHLKLSDSLGHRLAHLRKWCIRLQVVFHFSGK